MAYPDTIDSFVTLLDNVDTVFSAHMNDRGTAITNVETTLGANMKNVLYNKYMSIDSVITEGTDGDHDVDYPKIECRADDDLEDILVAAMTKRFDATWVAATGNGGMQAGESLAANTGYIVYAIDDSDRANNGDIQAVPIGTAFAYPAGYDIKRIFSFFHTDASSNIVAFHQYDNMWFYDAWQTFSSGDLGSGWTAIDMTNWVPSLLSAFCFGQIFNGGSFGAIANDNSGGADTGDDPNKYVPDSGRDDVWQFDIITSNTLYGSSDNVNYNLRINGFTMNKLR